MILVNDRLIVDGYVSAIFSSSVTTPQFAKDEDASIAKLQQVNESIQHQIDVQRSKLFLLEQEIQQLTQNL